MIKIVSEFLDFRPEKLVGNLGDNPGPVACFPIGVDGTAVRQGAQGFECIKEHLIRSGAINLGNETDATCVVFVSARMT
jgi:hypothetical protein